MASVIAYRLYVREYASPVYLRNFLFYNLISLLFLSAAVYYLALEPVFSPSLQALLKV